MRRKEKDHSLITKLYELKSNTTQKLLKEFQAKSWNERSLQELLRKLRHQFTLTDVQEIADRELCVLPRMCLADLMFTKECTPQTCQSECEFSSKTGIDQLSVGCFIFRGAHAKEMCLFGC